MDVLGAYMSRKHQRSCSRTPEDADCMRAGGRALGLAEEIIPMRNVLFTGAAASFPHFAVGALLFQSLLAGPVVVDMFVEAIFARLAEYLRNVARGHLQTLEGPQRDREFVRRPRPEIGTKFLGGVPPGFISL